MTEQVCRGQSGDSTLNCMEDVVSPIPTPQQELMQFAKQSAVRPGLNSTVLSGLSVFRADHPTPRFEVVYKPCLCIITQGKKRAFFAETPITYDPLHYLMVSVQLPLQAEIIEASPESPFLAIVLEIDAGVVSQLIFEMEYDQPVPNQPSQTPLAIIAPKMQRELSDSMVRLLRTLDHPMDRHILGPAAVREIFYHVLRSRQGQMLRSIALTDSAVHRIARVVRYLDEHYTEQLNITTIARAACMSESTLHHTFKEVTSLSPIQYLKKIRLHQARMLIINNGLQTGEAGYRVGYESASQFSREFKRVFGVPPSQASENT